MLPLLVLNSCVKICLLQFCFQSYIFSGLLLLFFETIVLFRYLDILAGCSYSLRISAFHLATYRRGSSTGKGVVSKTDRSSPWGLKPRRKGCLKPGVPRTLHLSEATQVGLGFVGHVGDSDVLMCPTQIWVLSPTVPKLVLKSLLHKTSSHHTDFLMDSLDSSGVM